MRMRMASEKGDGEEEEDPNNGADSISMADDGRRGRREGREVRDALLRPLGQRDGDDFPPLAAQ